MHSGSTQQVNEDDDCFFTIHRSNPKGGNTSVHWHTKDGTATSQPEGPPAAENGGKQGVSDYDAASGVATFNSEQPKNITVSVHTNIDSPDGHDVEYFFVVLTHAQNGVVVDNSGKCFISQAS